MKKKHLIWITFNAFIDTDIYVVKELAKYYSINWYIIRSENDKGIVMFIDDRYKQRKYKEVIQREYKNNYYVSSNKEIKEIIDDFWKST